MNEPAQKRKWVDLGVLMIPLSQQIRDELADHYSGKRRLADDDVMFLYLMQATQNALEMAWLLRSKAFGRLIPIIKAERALREALARNKRESIKALKQHRLRTAKGARSR